MDRTDSTRGRSFMPALSALLIGIVTLTQSLARPEVSALRSVYVVSLVASGACLGAALSALASAWVARRRS